MKSFVSCEQKVCVVCGKLFDTNTLIIDRKIQDSLESNTVTGYGLCQEHQDLYDKDYIALVEVDPTRSKKNGSNIRVEDAYRTGQLIHMKRDALLKVLKAEQIDTPLVFIEHDTFDFLMSLASDLETEEA